MSPMLDRLEAMLQAKIDAGPEAVPSWVSLSLVLIMALYAFSQVRLTYTHGSVIATLAMVEDESPTAVIAPAAPPPYADEPDNKSAPPAYNEEAIALVHTAPITASNRGAVRHLRRVGGRGSAFRGLGVALLHGFLTHCIANLVFWAVGGHAGAALGFFVSQIMLYRLNMLWTHIVMSAPSRKRFWQRVVPRPVAKRVLLPTMAWAGAHLAISAVLIQLTRHMDFEQHRMAHHGGSRHACGGMFAAKLVVLATTALGLLFFVYLPFNVALTRCQAALIAEDEPLIVPFDASFGGRTSLDGPRLKMADAWNSFDWNGRVRLLKVYARTVLYQILSTVFFASCAAMVLATWLLVDQQ